MAVRKKIGFVIKHHNAQAAELATQLGQFIIDEGYSVLFATESKHVAESLRKLTRIPAKDSKIQVVEKIGIVEHSHLVVVFGGDGTFLSIARLMKTRSVPILGVNMGQLGFLTEIKRNEAAETISSIMDGKPFRVTERALLDVTIYRKGKKVFNGPVVNDAVISKGAIARIIGLEISVNGKWVHNVRADGIIVSTPTGSTAYSLAAGGPVIEPSIPALILTAICPHSLTQRPLVIPDTSAIEIRIADRPGHVFLTLDGQDAVDLREGDIVTIHRFHKHSLKIISSPTRDYYALLREKLKFGIRD